MTQLQAGPGLVSVGDLRMGELLAEGGEGRVFELPLQPHLVYKAYRQPGPRRDLEALVAWPSVLAASDPEAAARVVSSSAWPCRVVTGRGGEPTGLLMPRAPRRFALRHRDGNSRLASLSYLTTDPAHRAAAYGLLLPPPASPERVGLALALARLLAAFESGDPAIGHGDLSTKNVLWSLQRGPEVFVIDCDNSALFSKDGALLSNPDRRRAMTPNWDDPAVPRGRNPTELTDRYSMALIFLRVVGAANFPIQARQRTGDTVAVDFPVPPGPLAASLLDQANPVWELCARGLSVSRPETRPPAAAWVPVLEAVLGRRRIAVSPAGEPGDVTIHPVPSPRRVDYSRRRSSPVTVLRPPPVRAPGSVGVPDPRAGAGQSIWPDVWGAIRKSVIWWLGIHRRPVGIRMLAFCGLIDLVAAIVAVFIVAMVVSPVTGI